MAVVSDSMSLGDDGAAGIGGVGGGVGGRPYTVSTFHEKVRQFERMLDALTLRNVEASPDERRQMISDNAAAFSKFCADVRDLFGTSIRDDDLQQLYRKVQANPDSNIDWSEVFGYFNVAQEDEELDDGNDVTVFATPLRRCIGDAAGGKKRRDVAKSIRFIKPLDSFVVAAQRGTVTFWSKKLEITSSSTVEDTLWIADCDYLPNLKRMICCTEKSLLVWDPRTKANSSRMFAIRPFVNVLHSMCVLPHPKLNEDVVLVGDDSGNISAITISSQDLVAKNSKAAQAANIDDVVPVDPAKLLTPVVSKRVHPTAVSKIKFFPELNCFGSCSASATTSFVLEEVHRLQATEELRGFNIAKGLTCFDYSVSMNLIVTGGPDKIVRLYIPHIDKPTGKLKGHLFTITGICVNDTDKHVISLSSARVIRVWDMLTMANLQVFSDKEDRLGEKRIHCIAFDPNLEVLITCSSVIECWPLTRNTQGSSQIPVTHDKPIALMLHNHVLGQLITICTVPVTIKVWDIKSGKLVYKINDPHGRSVEVTAATIDAGGYKLATGGADGTLKTWDFGSGRQLKALPDELLSYVSRKGRASVIQALCVHKLDKYRVLAAYNVGGNFMLFSDVDKIQFFQYLTNMDDELVPKSSGVQKAKVTCSYFLPPDSLITGMTDGGLAFWSLMRRRAEKVFALPPRKYETPARTQSANADDAEQSEQVNALAVLRCVHRIAPPLKASAAHDDDDCGTTDATEAAPADGDDLRVGGDSPSALDAAGKGIGVGGDVSGSNGDGEVMAAELARAPEMATTVLATVHQDATLRFWDPSGCVLLETVPEMRQTNQALTALAVNSSATYVVTGDSSGFLTLFRIAQFSSKVSAKADSFTSSDVTQVVTWRGHLSRVVNIAIASSDGQDVTYSASIDGSVRVWTGTRGHYVGYLGQAMPLDTINSGDTEGPVVKPCDISESPIEYEEIAKRDSRPKNPPKLEVPLVHTKHRRPEHGGSEENDEGVYFKSLEKPKPYRDHLPVVPEPKHSNKDGFVFRSLPVYQIITPERIKTPTPVLEKGLKSRSTGNVGKKKKQ